MKPLTKAEVLRIACWISIVILPTVLICWVTETYSVVALAIALPFILVGERVYRKLLPDPPSSMFTFQPRWKEELVCTCASGCFVLELPMGILSAYLPTEEAWKRKAPEWARDLWPQLKTELEAWCGANNARFFIDETATVY